MFQSKVNEKLSQYTPVEESLQTRKGNQVKQNPSLEYHGIIQAKIVVQNSSFGSKFTFVKIQR